MDDTTEKILLSLVSILFGLIAGQGWRLTQTWWNNRKLKKSLLTELEDIRYRLSQMADGYARSLQFYAHKATHSTFPAKLSHPFYLKHYTDVFLKLNHAQRNSYELIHNMVEALNRVIDIEADLITKFTKEYDEDLFEKWGNTLKAQYENIHLLWWHINFHLSAPDNPNLIEMHPEDRKHLDQNTEIACKHIIKIISDAKKFSREELYGKYNEVVYATKVKKKKEND